MGTRSPTAMFRLWLFVAGAAALAAVLGAVGFVEYLPTRPEFAGASGADIAYYTAQLFVIDPAPFDTPHPFPPALEIARFLAPATTIFVVVETIRLLVWERVRRWAAAHSAGHVVVAGADPVAFMLARKFAEDARRVVLVSDTVGHDVARQHGMFVVAGDPRQEATLRAAGVPRATTVYACGQDTATNLAVALATRRLATRPVTVQVGVRDTALLADLKAARRVNPGASPGMRLGFFVLDDLAARALLAQESLVAGYHQAAPVAVLGDGSFAQAVMSHLRRRQDPACPAPLTLITDQAAATWRPPAELAGARLYICLADPDLALRIALNQARGALSRVVLCLQQKSAFHDALSGPGAGLFDDAGGRLAVFGILDAACAAAPRDLPDELGRAIHDRYLRNCLANGDTPASNASLVPWTRLPYHLKQSNWAHAEHLDTKLATIGCVIVPAVEGGEPFAFRPGEVEQLARLEHERWAAERRAAGFEPGPVRTGRFHPDLIGWEELSEPSRSKDIDFIEHLPDLLEEAGYQIMRR